MQQRMLVVVPAFNNVMSGRAMPLSKGQKTRLAIRATVDPYNVVGAFVFGGHERVAGNASRVWMGRAGVLQAGGSECRGCCSRDDAGGSGLSDPAAAGSSVLPQGNGQRQVARCPCAAGSIHLPRRQSQDAAKLFECAWKSKRGLAFVMSIILRMTEHMAGGGELVDCYA